VVIKGSASKRKYVGLTPEMFEQLLAWLDEDRDQAGKKYEEIRFQLINIFISRGCWISEELADKTIDRVAGKVKDIAGTYIGDPALYFYGVAKMVYLEYVRSKPILLPGSPPQAEKESEQRYECLELCIDKLSPANRELLLTYYSQGQPDEDQRRTLAARMGLELNALWVRAHRIREKLRGCVIECLKNKEAQ
jgi:DNA-directed RNA polymerase specialized sigma24 family protein